MGWLPKTVHTLKVRGFHLLRRVVLDPGSQQSWQGVSYPSLRNLEVVFCGSSDKDLLHVCRLCPGLEHLTIVISMTPGHGGGQVPGQPPQHGLVASHLHSLCHNPHLVQCSVLVKVTLACDWWR